MYVNVCYYERASSGLLEVNALFSLYVSAPPTRDMDFEYTWRNWLLWGIGLTLIGAILIGLVVIKLMLYLKQKYKHREGEGQYKHVDK